MNGLCSELEFDPFESADMKLKGKKWNYRKWKISNDVIIKLMYEWCRNRDQRVFRHFHRFRSKMAYFSHFVELLKVHITIYPFIIGQIGLKRYQKKR